MNTDDAVRFRIEFFNTRDCSLTMLQLGEIRFYDNQGTRLHANNFLVISGDSTSNEQAEKAIDGTIFTKWVDRTFDCGVHLVTYLSMSALPWYYEFVTANDASHRDPVTWRMEMCYVPNMELHDCATLEVIDAYAPHRRWTSYGRFGVPSIAWPSAAPSIQPSPSIPTLSPTQPTTSPSTLFEYCPYLLVGAPCRTNRPVDMVLLLDSSSSIHDDDMDLFLMSLSQIVNSTVFNISKFGMAMFATFTELRIPIDDYSNADLSELVLGCSRLMGATYMDHALTFALEMWQPHLNAGHVQNTLIFTDGIPSNGHDPCDIIGDFHAAGIGFILVAIESANEDLINRNTTVFRCFIDQGSIVTGFSSFLETVEHLSEILAKTRSCDTLPTSPYDSQYEPTDEYRNGKVVWRSIAEGWEISWDNELETWIFTDPALNLAMMYDMSFTEEWKPPTGSDWMYIDSLATFGNLPILCMNELLDTHPPTSAPAEPPTLTPTRSSEPSASPSHSPPSQSPSTSAPTQAMPTPCPSRTPFTLPSFNPSFPNPTNQPSPSFPSSTPTNSPSDFPTTPPPTGAPSIEDCESFIFCSDCISDEGEYEYGGDCTLDFTDEVCGWYSRSEEIFQDHWVYLGENGAELYFFNGKWEIYFLSNFQKIASESDPYLDFLPRPGTDRDWLKADGTIISSLPISCHNMFTEEPSISPTLLPFPDNPYCCTFIFGSDCINKTNGFPDPDCAYDVQTPFNGIYKCDGNHLRRSTYSTDSGYQIVFHGHAWQITHSRIGNVGASEVCNYTSPLYHPPSLIDWIWIYDSTPFLSVPITCEEDFPSSIEPTYGANNESKIIEELQERVRELSEVIENTQTNCTQTCETVLTSIENIFDDFL